MKNIAIPLLLAGSAKAEAKKKAAMLQDYAEPEPILIASSWTGEVCEDEDGDVAAALSLLSTAEGEVSTLEAGLEALELAVSDAAEDRLDAIEAVLELDATMDSDVLANNNAIRALIGLKETWQAASVDASVGEADQAYRLGLEEDAQGVYDQAVLDYQGADGSSGLLGTWTTNDNDKGAAVATETGAASVAGSIDYRNAAHIKYAATNCTETSLTDAALGAGVSGAPGDDNFQIECEGTYSNTASANDANNDYTVYTQSLSQLETDVDDKLALKNTKELTKAAKYLKKIEYNQLQKYVGYAVTNASVDKTLLLDPARSDVGDANFTINHLSYNADQSTMAQVATYADTNAAMTQGNTNLDATTTTATASIDSKAKAWVVALQAVYGTVTGTSTSANVANDGNLAGDADSKEYVIRSGAAATSYAQWVTQTRIQVQGTVDFYGAYNGVANDVTLAAGELGSDGYNSAYTEVKGDDSGGSSWTGKCTISAGGTKYALSAGTTPTFSDSDWDDTQTMTLLFETSASSDSQIGAASSSDGASVCAMKCSTLEYWPVGSGNLPYTYLPDAGSNNTLTTTDTAAVSASLATMTDSYCIGFEVGATGTPNNTDQLTCDLYYGAFPTGNTTETGDSSNWACYVRDMSDAANTYSGKVVPTVAGDGTSDWDYFMDAMGVWGPAYQTLIDKRAELDIATYYHTLLNTAYTDTTDSNSDNVLETPGFVEQYNWNDSVADTGHLPDYTTASTQYTDATTDYTNSETAYSDRAVLIASANSDYLLAQAQLDENNALISKLTVLTEISFAAKEAANTAMDDASDALDDATDDWAAARDAYAGIAAADPNPAVLGFAELQTAAEADYDDAYDDVYGLTGTNTNLGSYVDGGDAPLGTLFGLRADAATALTDLEDAMDDLTDLEDDIADAQSDVQDALAVHLLAIVACKVENYDLYMETLQLAQQQREEDLDDILALVTSDEEDAPIAGAANSRCEKALSNGTFRPSRDETTCNEGLCCGAARIAQGNVMMTIETCQAEGTTEWEYVAPRAPMATTAPDAETVTWVCITGAKKLAAAASALATAVYMLA